MCVRVERGRKKLSHNKIPLPEHLNWKLATIVEIIESWRVIHNLLSRGHQPETIKALYPTIDDDYFKLITNYFKQYGAIDVETVFNSIFTDYRKKVGIFTNFILTLRAGRRQKEKNFKNLLKMLRIRSSISFLLKSYHVLPAMESYPIKSKTYVKTKGFTSLH